MSTPQVIKALIERTITQVIFTLISFITGNLLLRSVVSLIIGNLLLRLVVLLIIGNPLLRSSLYSYC